MQNADAMERGQHGTFLHFGKLHSAITAREKYCPTHPAIKNLAMKLDLLLLHIVMLERSDCTETWDPYTVWEDRLEEVEHIMDDVDRSIREWYGAACIQEYKRMDRLHKSKAAPEPF